MRHLLPFLIALGGCTPTEDAATDDTSDTAGPTCAYTRPDRPDPEPLKAGIARVALNAPIGSGTAGNNPLGNDNPSVSPFAAGFPATKQMRGQPEIKAVVLSRGEGHEAVFVRVDAIGMFSQLRKAIVNEVSTRMGRDMDHALLVGATHTHAAPGRLLNTGGAEFSFFDVIVGSFFPEFYERFVDAAADAVEAAYADLQPARLGYADAYCPDGHSDRRCEDGLDDENGTIPMIAVERDGEISALLMSYAIHGTIWGIDALTTSQDVSGAIEEAVEDRFTDADTPVEVLMFNSWAADMSVGSPADAPVAEPAIANVLGGDVLRARRAAWAVAEDVHSVLDQGLQYDDDPVIELEIHRVPIDREKIGYDDETFPYEYGAIYCQGGGECDPPVRDDLLDTKCLIQLNDEAPAPIQVDVTVGRVGDFGLVTFPGESGTNLAQLILADIAEAHPDSTDMFFLGYTQDYLGYSILEDDWWYGGYEASGSLWGPGQGEYLAGQIVRLYDSYVTDTCPGEEPGPLEPFAYSVVERYDPATPLRPGQIEADPEALYGPTDVVRFSVTGSDPWLGTPRFSLFHKDGDAVLRGSGAPVVSDDYNGRVELEVTPPWDDEEAESRTFTYTWAVPVSQPIVGEGVTLEPGDYEMKAVVPTATGDVTLDSSWFTVVAAEGPK